MQRIDPDRLAPEQPRKGAAGHQADVMAIGEDHFGVGMDFAVFQPRHAVVHSPGQFADFGMQRAAESDIHLLQATADPEQRNAAGDARLR